MKLCGKKVLPWNLKADLFTIVSLEFTSLKYRKEKKTNKLRDSNAG